MNLFRRSTLLFNPPKYLMKIFGSREISCTTYQYKTLYGYNLCNNNNYDITNNVTWSIKEGSDYATISSTGLLTIKSNANKNIVIIQAKYRTNIVYLKVKVTYIENCYGITTIQKTSSLNGSFELTIHSETPYEDGTSEVFNEITYVNADSIEYNRLVTILDRENNLSTQKIVKDIYQKDIVTQYNIDCSNSPNQCKNITGNGVNTEYIPFMDDNGYECDITFYAKYSEQPNPPIVKDKWDNGLHYKILSFKREYSPYPGWCLRFTSSKNLKISVTSNIHNRLTIELIPENEIGIYSLKFIYNPKIPLFKIINKYTGDILYEDADKFTNFENFGINYDYGIYGVTIGYALRAEEEYEYRFSNMTLYEFNLIRSNYD